MKVFAMVENISPERKVVTELEAGDASHVPDLFRGKFEEERLTNLASMKRIYKDDVASGVVKDGKLEFDDKHDYKQHIGIKIDGKSVYRDEFESRLMQHTDPTDKSPPDRQPLDVQLVQRVTRDLELGKPDSLASAMSGKYVEEASRFLHSVEDLNKSDLKSGLTAASLWIAHDGSKHRPYRVQVERILPVSSNFSFLRNPQTVYEQGWDLQNNKPYTVAKPDDRH